jgi:hypothetical protein
LHELTTEEHLLEMETEVSILLNKENELTDCIYGIINYIQE